MSYNGISISFACRLCTNSFEQIHDFIAHKKEKHFQEFQQTTCIVFEDKPSPNSSCCCVHYHLPPSALVKLETFDDETLKFEPEPQSDECISMQLNFEVIPNKIEPPEDGNTFEYEIWPQQPLYKNPFVLLKRLSRKEIQNSTENHSLQKNYDLTNHASNVVDLEEVSHSSTNGSVVKIKFKCRLCHEDFSSEPQLRTHVQLCLLYKNNKANSAIYCSANCCAKCNKFFPNSKELQNHIKCVHVQNIIVDKTVPATTTTPASLDSIQIKSQNKSNDMPISPTVTDSKQYPNPTKEFLNFNELQESVEAEVDNHLATFLEHDHHTTTFTNLKQNINTNPSDSTRFTCSFQNCQSTFKTKATLQRHSLCHTNFKPLKCSFPDCKLSFRHNWDLEQHFWRHTGLKPFKCPVPNCGKAFTNRGTMYNHKLTHAKTYSFKCPHPNCKQAFKVKRGLHRHLKAVHS